MKPNFPFRNCLKLLRLEYSNNNKLSLNLFATDLSVAKSRKNQLAEPKTVAKYFRWIHEDLSPWKKTGISNDMIMRARRTANFRLVIVGGKAYLETYGKAYQSRDTLNLWGILQLMRRYPGKLPDLDLLFDCNDPPVIESSLILRHPAVKIISFLYKSRGVLLEHFCYNTCHETTLEGWKAIGVYCRNLKSLYVVDCSMLCRLGLKALCDGCNKLCYLYEDNNPMNFALDQFFKVERPSVHLLMPQASTWNYFSNPFDI